MLLTDLGLESEMVLRKSGNRKVEEATEVLTEQSGLTEW